MTKNKHYLQMGRKKAKERNSNVIPLTYDIYEIIFVVTHKKEMLTFQTEGGGGYRLVFI